MLEESLKLNNVSDENIVKIKELVKKANELGFEFEEYDEVDDELLITFKIKN